MYFLWSRWEHFKFHVIFLFSRLIYRWENHSWASSPQRQSRENVECVHFRFSLSQALSSSPSLHSLRCTDDVGPGRCSHEATEQVGVPVLPPVPAIPFRNGSSRKIGLWLQPEACCQNTTSFWTAGRATSVLTLRLGRMLAPLGPLRVLRWRLRVIGYQHLGLRPWDGV